MLTRLTWDYVTLLYEIPVSKCAIPNESRRRNSRLDRLSTQGLAWGPLHERRLRFGGGTAWRRQVDSGYARRRPPAPTAPARTPRRSLGETASSPCTAACVTCSSLICAAIRQSRCS